MSCEAGNALAGRGDEAEAHGAGARVTATTDRRAALDGADYVVTSFQVGGYEPSTVIDFTGPEPVLVRMGKGSIDEFEEA